jgi:hypothetical protein
MRLAAKLAEFSAKERAICKPLPTNLPSSRFGLLHHSDFSQMLIKLTVANSGDQRIDHEWQFIE